LAENCANFAATFEFAAKTAGLSNILAFGAGAQRQLSES
jgi:hypothetical protein